MSVCHAYALVDCAGDPARLPVLQHHAATAGMQAASLFAQQPEAEHAAAGPWLLALPVGAIQPALDAWLAQLGRTPSGVMRLIAEVPFAQLLAHLDGALDIALPDGSLALMRYYDARAFARYVEVLTRPQQLELLGPILEWQVVAYDGQWALQRSALAQEAADVAAER
ncbi:DUF4123 domain-containing protein [Xanthomonas maliensis]|uniref:DUF4123 domain-containing protein n=1 Tax=Xanthomonas maliensis TaxID=1321368 RepID=UPI0003A8E492|nr:DUF4123 domain-containing protein [Xanthomonas maliensis]KAB7765650.1 DUF4123 domain-containing protein [Xanthomonas maliensis]